MVRGELVRGVPPIQCGICVLRRCGRTPDMAVCCRWQREPNPLPTHAGTCWAALPDLTRRGCYLDSVGSCPERHTTRMLSVIPFTATADTPSRGRHRQLGLSRVPRTRVVETCMGVTLHYYGWFMAVDQSAPVRPGPSPLGMDTRTHVHGAQAW